jgi:hypothetical protein
MPGLQSLAIELLQEIISLFSGCHPSSHPSRSLNREQTKALCDIRSTCKFINTIVEPTLFRHLVMRLRPMADLESPSSTQLRDLATGSTTASTCAEALTIRLFAEKMGEDDSIASFVAELAHRQKCNKFPRKYMVIQGRHCSPGRPFY